MPETNASPPVDLEAVAKARNDAVLANIRILENFYSFLVSLALTQATLRISLLWAGEGALTEKMGASVLYASLLVTIVPFYQGMNRFLYANHVVRPLAQPGSRLSPLLMDIYAFLAMSSLLFVMGTVLERPDSFFFCWSALLVIDIVWSCSVWAIQRDERPLWAINNLTWLLGAWLTWALILSFGPPGVLGNPAHFLAYAFVPFEIGRTILDYRINWGFYFPPEYRGRKTA